MKQEAIKTPDASADGLIEMAVDPLRYDGCYEAIAIDPFESVGLLRELMPRHSSVLDVGAGTGSATLAINEGKDNDVVAIEPDRARAAVCAARGIETRCGVLDTDLAATLGKFDVVLFTDVLEHLPAPASALKIAHDLLSEDGVVMASVPNVAHWTVRMNLLRGRFDYQPSGIMDATHLRWFTETSLRRLFEQSSFEVVTVRHSAGAWLPQYRRGPLRFLPMNVLRRVVRAATLLRPSLFACQLIVVARKRWS